MKKKGILILFGIAGVLLVAAIVLVVLVTNDRNNTEKASGKGKSASISDTINDGWTIIEDSESVQNTEDREPWILTYDELVAYSEEVYRVIAIKKGDLFYVPKLYDNVPTYGYGKLLGYLIGRAENPVFTVNFNDGDAIVEVLSEHAKDGPVYRVYGITGYETIIPYIIRNNDNRYTIEAIDNTNSPKIDMAVVTDINEIPCDKLNIEYIFGYGFLNFGMKDTITFSGYSRNQTKKVTLSPDDYQLAFKLSCDNNKKHYVRDYEKVPTEEGYGILIDANNNLPDTPGWYVIDGYLMDFVY